MNRNKKLAFNSASSLLLQVTTIICGFILPRLILITYGTDVNGLVHSISQFLGVVSLLDLGVGAVVQSSFYKPLANKDSKSMSEIYKSALVFFRKIAKILLIYFVLLSLVYPMFVKSNFDNTVQIITLILNTLVCVILINLNCSIQAVKFATSIVFLIRPICYSIYVNKKYSINYKVELTREPIKQKWSGMAQHFAAFLILGTDNIILTLFSSLANVSIYSVYYLVIGGINNLFYSITNGFQSLLGEMLAKKEHDNLKSFFSSMEWGFHTSVTLVFGCASVLILPFVQIYTRNVNDANYHQPLFAVLISLAYMSHCMRLPYHILIKAAGHYKETQSCYIVSMILNIVLSISLVKIFGLIGVAIGTLVSMLYQTIWMAWYDSKNIINWPFKTFLKQCGVDAITVIIASLATFKIPLLSVSYHAWFIQAIEVFAIWCVIVLIINLIFYKDKLSAAFAKISGKLKRA